MFYATIWALLPPVVAIALALITKEVYSSLFLGIVVGAALVAGFAPVKTLDVIINDGFIAGVADAWNVGIFLFLILLGILVALMNRAGGSAAFGRWAEKHVHTRAGAMLAAADMLALSAGSPIRRSKAAESFSLSSDRISTAASRPTRSGTGPTSQAMIGSPRASASA